MSAVLQPMTAVAQLTGTVLVVDDDIGLRETLCDILQLTGIDAATVGSASEASRWCDQHNPDLVILDQRLPDAAGLELAAQLKARIPLLPVVLLTGYVSTDSAIAAVGLVDDYLTKPVPPREFIKVVQTRLEQHRLRLANQDLLAQLQQANNSLERTVAERTRELSAARDQAMEASRLKSQFLANMSHEIRTPMNGVLGAAQLLATTELTDDQRSLVDILSDSGHALLAIINDVLDLSKIEAGHLTVKAHPFTLLEPFTQTVSMLAPQASAKGLHLSLDADPGLPLSVVGDAGLLRQVVTNLLGNAVKFTDAGHVLVTLRMADASADAVTLRCSVSDSGIGIAEHDSRRLFHEFTQIDDSDTRRFGGTGLGLAISERLIRLMRGDIGYAPNPGGGSTFWFSVPLPLTRAPGPAQDVAANPNGSAPSTTPGTPPPAIPPILIVEDNNTNAVLLTRMLTVLGYDSDTARSGVEALDAVAQTTYSTILMDCQMPIMDGFTTTRTLRARADRGPHIPIIAITGTATTEDKERCLAAGMDDYLPKPFTIDQLAAVLTRWAPTPRTA